MARCEECIHYGVCLKFADLRVILCGDKADTKCIMFKPIADVVEVVRCKDCVHYQPYQTPVEDFDGWCTACRGETDEDEFCSRGVRREQT